MTVEVEVSLYGLEQTALILLSDNGVVYQNQAGGNACMQPKAKGLLVPVTNEPPLDNLYEGALDYKLSSVCRDLIELNEGVADKIDTILKKELHGLAVVVDRARLNESMEAWIYVDVQSGSEDVKGFSESGAVLTWPNSD